MQTKSLTFVVDETTMIGVFKEQYFKFDETDNITPCTTEDVLGVYISGMKRIPEQFTTARAILQGLL